MAVEDSPNGALAAERAGAAVLVVPCEVPVPTGSRRTFRDDLVGLTAGELGAVLRAASEADEERWPDGRVRPCSTRPRYHWCRSARRAVRRRTAAPVPGPPGHPAHPVARRPQHAHPDGRVTDATTDTVSDRWNP